MARRTFIRLQLRKSSCDRVQSVLFSNYYHKKKKSLNRFHQDISSRDIAKSIKLSFVSSFVSLRAFGSKFWQFWFPVYSFQTKKKLHSIIFIRSWVLVYTDGRTDRHLLNKFYFFLLIKNIYTGLYRSRLFLKFHPHSDQS